MRKGRDVEYGIGQLDKQLNVIIELLPKLVSQAHRTLKHNPSTVDREDDVQRIFLLLIDRNFRALKTYDQASSLQTWLFTIVKRHIANRLLLQRRLVELDVAMDALVEFPRQELRILSDEREALLKSIVSNLTAHEEYLFQLIREGRKASEIAVALKITKNTCYAEKSALINKLRNALKGL